MGFPLGTQDPCDKHEKVLKILCAPNTKRFVFRDVLMVSQSRKFPKLAGISRHQRHWYRYHIGFVKLGVVSNVISWRQETPRFLHVNKCNTTQTTDLIYMRATVIRHLTKLFKQSSCRSAQSDILPRRVVCGWDENTKLGTKGWRSGWKWRYVEWPSEPRGTVNSEINRSPDISKKRSASSVYPDPAKSKIYPRLLYIPKIFTSPYPHASFHTPHQTPSSSLSFSPTSTSTPSHSL